MQEVYLCALFENNSIPELKSFFIHFKRANPRVKKVYFRITLTDMVLYCKESISSCYYINNNQVIEELKLGNQQCNNKYIIVQFQDFDTVVGAVNKIASNPKDVRIYLEQIEEQIYLTWNITQQDDTSIIKQTYIEFIEELEIVQLELQPMIIMPTYLLNQMATIAKNYDAPLRLNFYKQQGLYSVEIIVQLENDVPSFSTLFLASQHQAENLKQIDSFFQISKNYTQQFIDITSIEENIVITLDQSPTSPLVLNYLSGRAVEMGIVKQFIIQRMYS
ncbi:unnamed protein product [Paramecium sonneborni]|uniref:Uncharacterized protein n=1 Tax=Paramecium sonneborni TaxID=65129 RepID=A0A8S1P6V7_9CILI|nr:unnamed protein product [Paramecium sonneborni]